MKNPTFNNKTWWGIKSIEAIINKVIKVLLVIVIVMKKNLKSFSKYEIEILEITMKPFMKKFKYKTYSDLSNNIVNYLKFFLLIFIPTKYGVNLFFKTVLNKNVSIFTKCL